MVSLFHMVSVWSDQWIMTGSGSWICDNSWVNFYRVNVQLQTAASHPLLLSPGLYVSTHAVLPHSRHAARRTLFQLFYGPLMGRFGWAGDKLQRKKQAIRQCWLLEQKAKITQRFFKPTDCPLWSEIKTLHKSVWYKTRLVLSSENCRLTS